MDSECKLTEDQLRARGLVSPPPPPLADRVAILQQSLSKPLDERESRILARFDKLERQQREAGHG